jgi:hypothetical protein
VLAYGTYERLSSELLLQCVYASVNVRVDREEKNKGPDLSDICLKGRDRADTQICQWLIEPEGNVKSMRIHLQYNLRNHKDRIEIWDTGTYTNANSELVRGECYPCAFPMATNLAVPGMHNEDYSSASTFQGKPNETLIEEKSGIDSYTVELTVGPRVQVLFFTEGSRPDDQFLSGKDADSKVLGPHAFFLEFKSFDTEYEPPLKIPKARRSVDLHTQPKSRTKPVHENVGRYTNATSLQHSTAETGRDESNRREQKATTRVLQMPQTKYLALDIGEDWAWNANIPLEFGPETIHFVRQDEQDFQSQHSDIYESLQSEWDGVTTAEGLATGIAEKKGAGVCSSPLAVNQGSLVAEDADTTALSMDACLEMCGSIPQKRCTFFSFASELKQCLLFSECTMLLEEPMYTTYEVPYTRFSSDLECKVRMVFRGDQILLNIFDCGGSGGGIRRSFQVRRLPFMLAWSCLLSMVAMYRFEARICFALKIRGLD